MFTQLYKIKNLEFAVLIAFLFCFIPELQAKERVHEIYGYISDYSFIKRNIGLSVLYK